MTDFSPHFSHVNFMTNMRYGVGVTYLRQLVDYFLHRGFPGVSITDLPDSWRVTWSRDDRPAGEKTSLASRSWGEIEKVLQHDDDNHVVCGNAHANDLTG